MPLHSYSILALAFVTMFLHVARVVWTSRNALRSCRGYDDAAKSCNRLTGRIISTQPTSSCIRHLRINATVQPRAVQKPVLTTGNSAIANPPFISFRLLHPWELQEEDYAAQACVDIGDGHSYC